MRSVRHIGVAAAFGAVLALAGPGFAQQHEHEPTAHESHGSEAAHAEVQGHEDHEGEINVFYGVLGEEEGVEPSLLWRPVGMPPPLVASILNSLVLFYILFHFGRKPLAAALKKRKQRIVASIDEASNMRDEATGQLAEYEDKLKRIDSEIERLRREMREGAEAERKRILSDAEVRRERMERDAEHLIEQELKAARQMLMRETAAAAVRSAEEILRKELGAQDHQRLATDYLEMLKKSVNAVGGRA